MFNDKDFNNDLNSGYPNEQNQSNAGSYYSPRSGEPSDGGSYYGEEQPKKKSHKALKALGIFAGIALLSYASIQCYQFAMKNESLRKIFGKDSSVVTEETSPLTTTSENTTSAETAQGDSLNKTTSNYDAKSLIELASRDHSMQLPDIVDKLMPSSVGVSSTFIVKQRVTSMFGFGGSQTYEQKLNGAGTGIIMSEEGYILTNAHVIYDSEQGGKEATEVQVILNDKYYKGENQLNATIVGYDIAEDIAVLKIDSKEKLIAAEFGNSDDLRVGELVVAIGNPLGFELFGSVTTGIVSALDRKIIINENTMNLIQTDAAINQGNSGGPLINSYGQVIGINSAKLSNKYYSNATIEGLCFAIPISHAKVIVDDLIKYGYVRGKPSLGYSGVPITEEVSQAYGLPVGVYIREVTPGGAADLAGLKSGDIIIAIDGKTITDNDELNTETAKHKAGDSITVTVTRNREDIDFTLILQEKERTEDNRRGNA